MVGENVYELFSLYPGHVTWKYGNPKPYVLKVRAKSPQQAAWAVRTAFPARGRRDVGIFSVRHSHKSPTQAAQDYGLPQCGPKEEANMATAEMQDIARFNGPEEAVTRLEDLMGVQVNKKEPKMDAGRLEEPKAPVESPVEKVNGRWEVRGGGYFRWAPAPETLMESAKSKTTTRSPDEWAECGMYLAAWDTSGKVVLKIEPKE